MKISNAGAGIKNLEAAIVATYGSYENYINSRVYRETLQRLEYLTVAKSQVNRMIKKDMDVLKHAPLRIMIAGWLARKIVMRGFNKKIQCMIGGYMGLIPCVLPFALCQLNDEFDRFCFEYQQLFSLANLKEYKYVS
jgi:hypothetical protein